MALADSLQDTKNPLPSLRLAGIAQLVEQLICNQQVTGSIPVASSRNSEVFIFLQSIRHLPPQSHHLSQSHHLRGRPILFGRIVDWHARKDGQSAIGVRQRFRFVAYRYISHRCIANIKSYYLKTHIRKTYTRKKAPSGPQLEACSPTPFSI